MDRLRGLPSFVAIAASVLGVLRLLHVGVPAVFPETRQGPIAVASLDEARRRAGFAPLVPAYRPESLGERPLAMTVTLSPHPTFTIVWQRGDEFLSVTQRRGGARPVQPPLARPLDDVPDSGWWLDGGRAHLVLPRDGFWVEIATSLPPRDLRRLADTLTPY
jgi:hypothetical protein